MSYPLRRDLAPGTVFHYASEQPHTLFYVSMVQGKGVPHPKAPQRFKVETRETPVKPSWSNSPGLHEQVKVVWAPPVEPEVGENEYGEVTP